MKKFTYLIIVMVLLVSCNTEHEKARVAKNKLKSQYELVDEFKQTYQRFMLNKYDGHGYSYTQKPNGITELKYDNPELYQKELAELEHIWDSVMLISKDIACISGMTETMMKYKEKNESYNRIKVKKSDNVVINLSAQTGSHPVMNDSIK